MNQPRLSSDRHWVIFPGTITAVEFAGITVQTYARKIRVPLWNVSGATVHLDGEDWKFNSGRDILGREVEVMMSRTDRENVCISDPGRCV
jgi:hypothetical protein